jgi:glycosyltransferase involved in cell wall biosynthesis
METKTCVIAGCARNIASYLPKTLEQIEQIRTKFKETAVVIGENNSTDGTKALLHTYMSSTPHTHILTFDDTAGVIVERTVRLAHVRNAILDFIHTAYVSFDYILIVDLDGTLDGFKLNTLEKAFDPSIAHWDALFANNKGVYYDIWALRDDASGPVYDCWDMYRHLVLQVGIPPSRAKQMCITQFQKRINPRTPPFRVRSAFGGLGLYRMAATIGCKYNGQTTECSCRAFGIPYNPQVGCRQDTCEHVAFHADMIRLHGAALYIHPGIQVSTQLEHV